MINNPMASNLKESNKNIIIRVAILAEEPIGWGSGKNYFKVILDGYNWNVNNKTYKFSTKYVYDKDIIKGKLNIKNFDILIVPGGGVGDGNSIMKGFTFLPKVRKWKKNISDFIKEGGGYVGICGGTALITGLITEDNKHRTFIERLYDKSSLGVSCVSSYYRTFAFPLFYPFQNNHPEKIGASAYVFSFAPAETRDGLRIHAGGMPLDFQILKDHPIFSDFKNKTERIRWWGGPALILPKNTNREVKILAKYPSLDIANNESIKIHAWKYKGGIHGLVIAFLKSLKLIKKEKGGLKNVFLYTFFLAGNWKLSESKIELDYSNRPSITAEIYPNEKKGRMLLCTAHPEYMIWWDGYIKENKTDFNCLANGLYKWENIAPLSKSLVKELTHTWWMIRRFAAWTAKIKETDLPPIKEEQDISEAGKNIISENILWDGTLKNQMINI
jgi:glutamine amidotransferase-like uncharacterized protein